MLMRSANWFKVSMFKAKLLTKNFNSSRRNKCFASKGVRFFFVVIGSVISLPDVTINYMRNFMEQAKPKYIDIFPANSQTDDNLLSVIKTSPMKSWASFFCVGNGINLTKQGKSFMIIKFVMNFSRCLLRFGVNDDFNGLAVNRGNSIEIISKVIRPLLGLLDSVFFPFMSSSMQKLKS